MNQQSRAAIARLGAKQDGILRNHQRLADGSLRDTVVFSHHRLGMADDQAPSAIQTRPQGNAVLIDFFFTLKDAKIPVSIKEFLILLEAMQKSVIRPSLDDFYYLSRMTLVKDEAHYDKFDQAFGQYFKGIEAVFDKNGEIPLDWLVQAHEARADAGTDRRSWRNSATTS